jgi:molecular chaperone DnaK
MSKVIGIDLGTTNSVVAVMEGGVPVVITNSEGGRVTPSVVGVTRDGTRLVGQAAKRQAVINPENTIYAIKRFMGRRYGEVTDKIKQVPYEVVPAPNGDAHVVMGGKEYSPPEISAMILQKLKQAAEDYLGQKVTQAIITVPVMFNDAQRRITKVAGWIAGLEVLRIIDESLAVALAYGLDKKKEETIAVFDFGGGAFNISILGVGEGVIEVKSINGDAHLGGEDIDERLIQWIVDEFKKDQGIDLSKDKMSLQRLKEAAERAKIELSSTMETEINLPFISADQSGPKHLVLKLARAKFESLVDDILQRTLEPCRSALKDAELAVNKIDKVILAGGSTRIPKIQGMVKDFFGKEPHKGVNPDEVAAVGAAVHAGVLSGEVTDMLSLEVIPASLGIETAGGAFTTLIKRNTTIPTRKSEVFSTDADNQTSFEVHVLQGDRPMAADNLSLSRFHLDGIPPAPRGMPQIEVTFDIDANCIVNVQARDLGTGREEKLTIAPLALSREEIEQMRRDAEARDEEDKRKSKLIVTKNRLDTLIYQTERVIADNRHSIPPAIIEDAEVVIAGAKRVIDSNDLPQFLEQLETLAQTSHQLTESLHIQPNTETNVDIEMKGPDSKRSATAASNDDQSMGSQSAYDGLGVHPTQDTSEQQSLLTIFISYAHQDGVGLARRLVADLRAHGFETWWDDGIQPGSEWEKTIREAIDRSDAMVVLFTEAATYSSYLDAEWHYAHDVRKIPVIPVLAPGFDDDNLPLVLRRIQWADIRADYDFALSRLVIALPERVKLGRLFTSFR